MVGFISAQENVTDICETEQEVLSLACQDLDNSDLTIDEISCCPSSSMCSITNIPVILCEFMPDVFQDGILKENLSCCNVELVTPILINDPVTSEITDESTITSTVTTTTLVSTTVALEETDLSLRKVMMDLISLKWALILPVISLILIILILVFPK